LFEKMTSMSHPPLRFFLHYLDELYLLKSHLLERLPLIEFAGILSFMHTELLVQNTTDQLKSIRTIYNLLEVHPDKIEYNSLSLLLDDAYEAIKNLSIDPELRNLSALFYIQKIQSLEIGLFPVLQIAFAATGDHHLMKLLTDNFTYAKAGRALVLKSISDFFVAG
jgi:ferritin-like metal-binding protein YciE